MYTNYYNKNERKRKNCSGLIKSWWWGRIGFVHPISTERKRSGMWYRCMSSLFDPRLFKRKVNKIKTVTVSRLVLWILRMFFFFHFIYSIFGDGYTGIKYIWRQIFYLTSKIKESSLSQYWESFLLYKVYSRHWCIAYSKTFYYYTSFRENKYKIDL